MKNEFQAFELGPSTVNCSLLLLFHISDKGIICQGWLVNGRRYARSAIAQKASLLGVNTYLIVLDNFFHSDKKAIF